MKRLLLTVLLLALPLTAAASTQVLVGGNSAVTNVNYAFLGSLSNAGHTLNVLPTAGSVGSLNVWIANQPAAATSWTFTTKKDNTNQSPACTISSTPPNTCTSANTFNLDGGDALGVQVTKVGTPSSNTVGWSMVFTPTTANDTELTSFNNGTDGQGVQTYRPISGGGDISAIGNSEQVFPEAGVVDFLTATTTTLTQGTYQYTFMKNQASTSLTCTITTSVKGCVDSSGADAVSVAQGDRGTFAITPQGTPNNSAPSIGARFVPTTAGDFDFFAGTGQNLDTANATRYLGISGANFTLTATEASTSAPMPEAFYITGLYVKRSAAAGSAHTATITVRDNSADTAATCQISGTSATTCTFSGAVLVSTGDLLDVSIALSASGTTGSYKIGIVGNTTNPNQPPTKPATTNAKNQLFGGFFRLVGGFFQIR